MTKHTPDDTLKCHLTVEEPKKLVTENALAVCNVPASPKLESKLEVPQTRTGIKTKNNRPGKIMPELYNLEDCAESEKTVKIDLDLDLYQMETV